MKRILTLFIAFMASTCIWAGSDFYDEESKLYYLITGNTTVEVTSEAELGATYFENYRDSKFSIPSTVTYEGKTYRVTSIGPNAFTDCKALTTITIAENVTSIQEFAFASCPKLKSITIPNSVKSIDNSAFDYCTALSKIFVCGTREFEALSEFDVIYCDKIVDGLVISSQDNPNGYAEIIDYTGPTNITSITIPEEAEDIREGVFNQCKSLKSITWNAKKCGNTYGEPFDAIKQNITSFVFGDKVEHIPANLCNGMSKLTSVTIPESVKSIGKDAFIGTGIYTNKSNWKNGALYINNCLIAVDKNATSYTIMPDTRLIAGGVFKNCSKLTSITIPESVISIGEEAFEGCTALTTITIPESVTSIASFAFNGTAFYDNTSNWENGALYINNCLIDIDRNKENKDFIIKPGTRLIAAHACYSCETLESITIPESVQSIGDYAFLGCYSLKSITIPESVKSIGEGITEGCEALEKIFVHNSSKNKTRELEGYSEEFITYYDKIVDGLVISNNEIVTLIDPNTITTVNIPEGVTSIAADVFEGCSSLKSVTINSNAIANSSNLKDIFGKQVTEYIIGNSVTSIGRSAFSGCSSLTAITIQEGVKSIGTRALDGCKSLKSITIPKSVTSIGEGAFKDCYALTSVTINSKEVANYSNLGSIFGQQVKEYIIGNNVTSIREKAFQGCSNMTNITIPTSVTSIGDYAFSGCSSLATITLPDSVAVIGSSAFAGCSKLTSITIPERVTNIGDKAFDECSSLTSIVWNAKNCGISSPFAAIKQNITNFVLGDKVELIPAGLCGGMSQITSITIPVSVASIGEGAFYGCEALKTINYAGTKKLWKSIEDTNLTIEPKKQIVVICSDGEVKLRGK